MLLDINRAVNDLAEWLELANGGQGPTALETLGTLFERHDPLVSGIWPAATAATLEKLLTLAYGYVDPRNDAVREGAYTPDARDNAEEARNAILSALMARPGAEAYRVLVNAQSRPAFASRVHRFRELARSKAEQDTEPPAWTEAEVFAFVTKHAAPVKTGHDLLRVTLTVLDDIQFSLRKNDVTSRPLLERAKDEDEVQNWLVEQMNFRAEGRFRAFREAQVALGDKPDVIVSSTSAPFEVAIEVKHGGKDWPLRSFESALRKQLAEDYLKPEARRHGVLVITNHRKRTWRDTATGENLDFAALVGRLTTVSRGLVQNKSGAIEVVCVGIDATATNVVAT
jgi:hypothetical protein